MGRKVRFILTIAGSDPSGGAGIQSDLKTFRNHGLYGLSVITSVTAQNTTGVQKCFKLPAEIISSQLVSLFSDFEVRVVKTGMLSSGRVIKVVGGLLKRIPGLKLIIDPVIRSKNGYELLGREGIEALKQFLMPIAYLITPNFSEAEVLARMKIRTIKDIETAARTIIDIGCRNVLLKGGHLPAALGIKRGIDILYDGRKFHLFRSEFVKTKNTHGIGCTFSAAIASNIALGFTLKESIAKAKVYVVESLLKSRRIGKGYGPVEQVK